MQQIVARINELVVLTRFLGNKVTELSLGHKCECS